MQRPGGPGSRVQGGTESVKPGQSALFRPAGVSPGEGLHLPDGAPARKPPHPGPGARRQLPTPGVSQQRSCRPRHPGRCRRRWQGRRWQREAGPGLGAHGRRGITGLRFLREQNNYKLHRGPESPESSAGSRLRATSSGAEAPCYLDSGERKAGSAPAAQGPCSQRETPQEGETVGTAPPVSSPPPRGDPASPGDSHCRRPWPAARGFGVRGASWPCRGDLHIPEKRAPRS